MKVGVKYCGGCNPRFDRTGLLNKLKKEFETVSFEYSNEENSYDVLAVLCGCTAACADISKFKANDTVVISDESGYEKIKESIVNLL